jgi:hypothetical protein
MTIPKLDWKKNGQNHLKTGNKYDRFLCVCFLDVRFSNGHCILVYIPWIIDNQSKNVPKLPKLDLLVVQILTYWDQIEKLRKSKFKKNISKRDCIYITLLSLLSKICIRTQLRYDLHRPSICNEYRGHDLRFV